jgi:BRCT domain type II-containing protein
MRIFSGKSNSLGELVFFFSGIMGSLSMDSISVKACLPSPGGKLTKAVSGFM